MKQPPKANLQHLLEENLDNLTGNNHGALIDTASEVLDKARKKRRSVTNNILDLRDEKKSQEKEKRLWQFKTYAAGGCLAYHAKNTKQTNMHSDISLSSPDVRNFYLFILFQEQPSSVASYHN